MMKFAAPFVLLAAALSWWSPATAQVSDPDSSAAFLDSLAHVIDCPGGDGTPSSPVNVQIRDRWGGPVIGYPAESVFWAMPPAPPDLSVCVTLPKTPAQTLITDMGWSIMEADGLTDSLGMTQISFVPPAGGHTVPWASIVFMEDSLGFPAPIDTLVHQSGVKSVDINNDFLVNFCDLGLIAADVGKFTSAAMERSDLNLDGFIDLVDVATVASHRCHQCIPPPLLKPDAGTLGIYFDMAGTQSTLVGQPVGIPFNIYVVAQGITGGLKALEFAVRSTDPSVIIMGTSALHPQAVVPTECSGPTSGCRLFFGTNCVQGVAPVVLVQIQAILVAPVSDALLYLEPHPTGCRNAWYPPPEKPSWGPVVARCPPGTTELDCDLAVPLQNRAVINPVATDATEPGTMPGPALTHGIYPNPFNPMTTIRYQLRDPGVVQVQIWDFSGRMIRELVVPHVHEAGIHEAVWSGRDDRGRPVASGVYFYRITAGHEVGVGRMVLLK